MTLIGRTWADVREEFFGERAWCGTTGPTGWAEAAERLRNT